MKLLSFVLLFAGIQTAILADGRSFTHSNEARSEKQGELELEQWMIFRTDRDEGTFRQLNLQHEFEYGVTNRLTTALYLKWGMKNVSGVPGEENEDETEFESLSNEWKYKFSDPVTDLVGFLLYGEIEIGDDERELETKIVFSKTIGNLTLAYNTIFQFGRELEADAGENEWETESALLDTFGISYSFHKHASVGLEALHHMDFDDTFGDMRHNAYFVGPAVHVEGNEWWAVLTVLKQIDLSDSHGLVFDGHEKYEVRLIIGFDL